MHFRPATGFNKSPLPLPKDILDVVKRLTGQGAVSAPPPTAVTEWTAYSAKNRSRCPHCDKEGVILARHEKICLAKQKRLARTAAVS